MTFVHYEIETNSSIWRIRTVLTQLDAFVVGVEQEGAEAVGHVVVGQELQVVLTELKLHGELQVDLRVGGRGGIQSQGYSLKGDADTVRTAYMLKCRQVTATATN